MVPHHTCDQNSSLLLLAHARAAFSFLLIILNDQGKVQTGVRHLAVRSILPGSLVTCAAHHRCSSAFLDLRDLSKQNSAASLPGTDSQKLRDIKMFISVELNES